MNNPFFLSSIFFKKKVFKKDKFFLISVHFLLYVCFQISLWTIFDTIPPRAWKNQLLPKIFFSVTFISTWRCDTLILTFGERAADTST